MLAHTSLSAVYCRNRTNPKWDEFVQQYDGDIQQTSAWTSIYANDGVEILRFYLTDGNAIVGGAQILKTPVPFMGHIGVIQQGPCVCNDSVEIHDRLFIEAREIAAKEGLKYIAVIQNYNTLNGIDSLIKLGFKLKPSHLPPNPIVKSTLILDLGQPLDSILANMKKGRRKSIQKGLTSPIEHKMGGREDLETFFNLMLDTCRRRKSKPLVDSLDLFYKVWDSLAPSGLLVLHLTLVESKAVCASLGLTCGNTYKNWFWGWNGEYANYNISDVTDWKTIVWAKQAGFRYYDFVHIDRTSAEAIESDQPIAPEVKTRSHFGSTFYKMQFGGKVIHYPEIFCYYPNKINYFILHLIGGIIFESEKFRSFVISIIKRMKKHKLKAHPIGTSLYWLPEYSWQLLELGVI